MIRHLDNFSRLEYCSNLFNVLRKSKYARIIARAHKQPLGIAPNLRAILEFYEKLESA